MHLSDLPTEPELLYSPYIELKDQSIGSGVTIDTQLARGEVT